MFPSLLEVGIFWGGDLVPKNTSQSFGTSTQSPKAQGPSSAHPFPHPRSHTSIHVSFSALLSEQWPFLQPPEVSPDLHQEGHRARTSPAAISIHRATLKPRTKARHTPPVPPRSAFLIRTKSQRRHHGPEGIFTNIPVTHMFTALPRVAIPFTAVTKSGKPTKWDNSPRPQQEIYKLLIFIDTSHSLFGEDFKPPGFCLDFNEKVTNV